jgi:hypothetical protein
MELADTSGMSEQQIGRHETGEVSFKTTPTMAEGLSLNFGALLPTSKAESYCEDKDGEGEKKILSIMREYQKIDNQKLKVLRCSFLTEVVKISEEEYAISTDIISEGTFGIKTKKHEEKKGLKEQPLRDHITPIELIFNMLGEQATIDEKNDKDTQGYKENLEAAKKGSTNAGTAREAFEKVRGIKVVSPDNFSKKIKD